ncbi:class I SAM-dependent methyltransferase [Modestobacter sp. VKM Ac-2979]|uniref:class I SAM-dependent methyltransferase n=1 Tax=unclassified Modestobacter TaxID=2643866 RepID=UPI0022ABB019|nr:MULTISPECIES: class I SAM-dependent methyltransferase [unclassified Modestobacter]MCZ2813921.1 class I SAM-dependent methyltransferase [Modestobacter sp. VKM Ac-2979]MCZ2844664.1 class I SAM-dependent methyltransferase [Modestobacter sp. VKM Ac-2980]
MSTAEDRERRRSEQRRLVAELLPFRHNDELTFFDLSAGTGVAARAVLDRYPGAMAVLADYSPQMMAEGDRALGAYGGRYTYVEIDLANGPLPPEIPGELGAVITSICLHHFPDERKERLFEEVLARLIAGGWFLNFDPVTADDPVVRAAWQRANARLDPAAAARNAPRSPEEQLQLENHVRYMNSSQPAGSTAADRLRGDRHVLEAAGRCCLRRSPPAVVTLSVMDEHMVPAGVAWRAHRPLMCSHGFSVARLGPGWHPLIAIPLGWR